MGREGDREAGGLVSGPRVCSVTWWPLRRIGSFTHLSLRSREPPPRGETHLADPRTLSWCHELSWRHVRGLREPRQERE